MTNPDTNNSESDSPFNWAELSTNAIDSIKNCDLSAEVQIPTFPAALMEFLKASEDPDVRIQKLAKIIEHDPGLTLDLMKCVNVCKYANQARVRNPTEALVRMGISGARAYLLVIGMQTTTLSFESKLMNHRNFWNESMQKALFAQNAAKLLSTDASFAFLGGLLQDYILPVLTNQYDSEYIEYLKNAGRDGVPLHEWEQAKFGWNHASAAAFVASKWHLPDDLLCAIFLHHFIELPVNTVEMELFALFPITLAALLPDQLRQVPSGVERLIVADQQSKAFDLNALCDQVDLELENIAEGHDRPKSLRPAIDAGRQKVREASANLR
jgi:HD-like signal output (HDOD) protein